jgi:hypothetical protein
VDLPSPDLASFSTVLAQGRLRLANKIGIFEKTQATHTKVGVGGAAKIPDRSGLPATDTNPVFHSI